MPYDSPKTLRRRQHAAENRVTGKRRAAAPKILTSEEWGATCDFHIGAIHEKSIYPDSVAAHAGALVHMAIERRAGEIQRDFHRAYLDAMAMAETELLGTEVA